MTRNVLRLLAVAALAAPLALGACKRSDTDTETAAPPPAPAPAPAPKVESPPPAAAPAPAPFRVTSVEVGNAISADKRVTTPTATLSPGDTIYASVASDGSAPSVTLTARWTYEDGQVVDETTQTIAPNGPAASEFHISHPDGFPAGRYQVEILADGRSVETEQFEVR
jgi:hypothetical protein